MKRNSIDGIYSGSKANNKACVRRSNAKYQPMSIVNNRDVRKEIDDLLYDDISPENVAGRINKKNKNIFSTSKNTIYRYIYSIYGRKIEHHRKIIKYKNRRKVKLNRLEDRINISKRPKVANNRKRYGDAEGDSIVSGKGGSGILLVVVDRKIRKVFLKKILPVSILNIHNAFLEIKEKYINIKTLTLDNDILFRKHLELKKILKLKIYFCNPYHSWEKGGVENANKYIRRYIKKSSDISLYSNEYIQKVEDKLNRRPMKCLTYNTPNEEFVKYLKRTESKKKLT